MPLESFSIIESTLREGEQFVGANFTTDQKVEIARLLDAFGVECIELTSPLASPQSYRDAQTIASLGLRARILTHVRCRIEDAQRAIDTGVDGVDVVIGTSSVLRKFSHGKDIDEIADMALESQIKQHRFPYATLAFGLAVKERKVYYGMVSRTFDYSAQDRETESMTRTYLLSCDLETGKKENLGQMVTTDGRIVLGLGACEVAPDGKVYFCGAITEDNPDKIAGLAAGRDPYSLQLMVWDPSSKKQQ